MKKSLRLLVLMCGVLLTGAFAGTKQPYQSATVVSVANHETPSVYIGDPSDAPLQSEVYSYDIAIELNCTVYTVRYETGLDYLPSVFSPNQTVEVSLQKHVMNVNLPGARRVRLSIGRRTHVKSTSCVANNQPPGMAGRSAVPGLANSVPRDGIAGRDNGFVAWRFRVVDQGRCYSAQWRLRKFL